MKTAVNRSAAQGGGKERFKISRGKKDTRLTLEAGFQESGLLPDKRAFIRRKRPADIRKAGSAP